MKNYRSIGYGEGDFDAWLESKPKSWVYANKNGWVEFYGADGMEGVVQPLNEDWIIGSVQYANP